MEYIKNALILVSLFLASLYVGKALSTGDINPFDEPTHIEVGQFDFAGVSENTPIVMYTQEGCKACDEAKAYFEKKKVEYLELDVRDQNNIEKVQQLEMKGTPVLLVGNFKVLGFHEPSYDELLKLYQSNEAFDG